MYEPHYAKLLTPYFSGEQLETLIKLINLMQDPCSFEIGIMQLRAQKLYEPLTSFLENYAHKWHYYIRPDNMIENMFATKIEYSYEKAFELWFYEGELPNGKKFDGLSTYMVLPLFSKEVVQITITTQEGFKTTFGNAQDVKYDIRHVYCDDMTILGNLPSSTKAINLVNVDFKDVIEQHHLPINLEEFTSFTNVSFKDDAILHLQNLHTFGYKGYIQTLQFPPNIKKIIEHEEEPYFSPIGNMRYVVKNNPKLEQIQLVHTCEDTMQYLQEHFFEYKGRGLFERGIEHIQ